MNSARLTTSAILAAALGLGLGGGCTPPDKGDGATQGPASGPKGADGKGGAKASAPVSTERVARRVEVVEVQPQAFDEKVEATAAIEAIEDVTLTARAAGTVDEVLDRGTVVKKGQVVARLDDTLSRAALAQAEAGVSAAQAGLDLAQDALDRQKPLFEQQIISPIEFENIRTQVAQARAQTRQAQAARAQARAQVELSRVVAPFDGRIEQRFVDPGGQINPGQPVVRVVDVTRVKAVAGVPERYATDIAVGAGVDINFSAYGVPPREAEVSFVGSAIDAKSRTFEVEAVLDNPDGKLKPQMVARMRVVRARHPDALVVPLGAVVRDETGDGVFVIAQGEKGPIAHRRKVELGARSGDRIEVAEGLKAGERIVTVGQSNLTDDDPVSIVGPATPTEAAQGGAPR